MADAASAKTETPEDTNAADEGHAQPSGSKPHAVKDKKCQFCHQAFTSSSLGRHLDQYLFKKKPDGIHDIEEIRRLRGGITRRTAKSTTSKRQSPDPDRAAEKQALDPHSAAPLQLNNRSGPEGYKFSLNKPSWHSTGVINDIPGSSQDTQARPRTYSRLEPNATRRASDSVTAPETARALELALREVLDNIKAATARIQPRSSPFDFDLQTQTFPALCLQALPPPQSIFSTSPFPSPTSFPLNPPGVEHREILLRALLAQIQQWKSDQLAAVPPSPQSSPDSRPGRNVSLDPYAIERNAQQHEEAVYRHVDLALGHWMSISPAAKQETWQLELTRSFVREQEKRTKLESQLARTQQEANQLRAQIERLEVCQWPREFALFPPDMLPLSTEVARELDAKESKVNAPDSSRWDYDNVVAKWKRAVMHDKSMGRPGVGPLGSIYDDNADGMKGKRLSTPRSTNPITPESPLPSISGSRQPSYQTQDPNNSTTDSLRPIKRPRTGHGSLSSNPYDAAMEAAARRERERNPSTPRDTSAAPQPQIPSSAAHPPTHLTGLMHPYNLAPPSSSPSNPTPYTTAPSMHTDRPRETTMNGTGSGSAYGSKYPTSSQPNIPPPPLNSRESISRHEPERSSFQHNHNQPQSHNPSPNGNLDILMSVCSSQAQANGR